MSLSRFTKKTFTSNGSWTAPAGVTKVLVWGMGGGSGGEAGLASTSSGLGGLATTLQPVLLDVTPNTTYTITIGAGGNNSPTSGAGGDTSFGALMTWVGAPSSLGGHTGSTQTFGTYRFREIVTASNMAAYSTPGETYGGVRVLPYPNLAGIFGTIGTDDGSYVGGGAGMSGLTAGGNGGNGNSAGAGGAGVDAPANSGAGGGGAGAGTTIGVLGGKGGSGLLTVMWVE